MKVLVTNASTIIQWKKDNDVPPVDLSIQKLPQHCGPLNELSSTIGYAFLTRKEKKSSNNSAISRRNVNRIFHGKTMSFCPDIKPPFPKLNKSGARLGLHGVVVERELWLR